jgi:hypothetical protein
MRQQVGDRVVIGVVVSASVAEPSTADAITYTIEIDDGGEVQQYSGVSPGRGWRPTDYDTTPDGVLLLPWPPGTEVPVAIRVKGPQDVYSIMASEQVSLKQCTTEP